MHTPSLRRARGRTADADPAITVHRRHGLEVTQVRDRNRATVQVCGEMDAISAPLLFAVAIRSVESGVSSIRLDLSRLTFCDAAGLRAVVEIHEQLCGRHGVLTLAGLRPKTRQLLAITGMDEVLNLDDAESIVRLSVVGSEPTIRRRTA